MVFSAEKRHPGAGRATPTETIHVMVVDDSAVVRGLITRMLEADDKIEVVASVGNGQLAVNNLGRYDVDVIILDIEMPVMDGLTAIPKLLEINSDVKIIMASTLTLKNAEVSIRALEAGASDYIPKPTSSRELSGGADFRRELLDKVRTLGTARHAKRPPGATRAKPVRAKPAFTLPSAKNAKITLRDASKQKPDVIAIGSSTGGPQALFALLSALRKDIRVPIFITQHMPATFTTILADHITRMSGWPCAEAKDGDLAVGGHIYLAPGDYHMTVESRGTQKITRLNQDPPENFCRPSADVMLRSIDKAYGSRVLVAILTGMGQDGLKGSQQIVDNGGTVVAQDEATSVVWGMPGAVAQAGICSVVKPLKELATYMSKLAGRGIA